MAGIAAVSLTACTANYLDYNTEPGTATSDDMKRDGYIVSSALSGIMGWVIPTDVNTNQFTETLVGGPYGGYIAESNSGFTNNFSCFNQNEGWNRVLYKDIIPKIFSNIQQLYGVTEDPIYFAIAKIVKVAGISRVTDAYGPIPYTQIGAEGKLTAPLDPQKTVYQAMINELDEAIEVLLPNRTSSFSANADKVFGGSIAKWIKLANSYKLRLGMRTVYADAAFAKATVESALDPAKGGVMESNADNAFLQVAKNPFRVICYEYNGGDARMAADIVAYMNGYKDPRRGFMMTQTTFTDEGVENGFAGIRIGGVNPDKAIDNEHLHAYSNIIVEVNTKLMWMVAAEVEFLKAEAALRGWSVGESAESCYNKGIKLSFEQWGAGDAAKYIADDQSLPELYKDPLGKFSYNGAQPQCKIKYDSSADFETNLERIITQKWIANFPNGNEAWAEFRRTGYPKLMVTAKNANASQVPAGEFARRLFYPQDEYLDNGPNVKAAISDLNPQVDLMSSRVWWDCNPNTK